MFKKGDVVVITGNGKKTKGIIHRFPLGEKCVVMHSIGPNRSHNRLGTLQSQRTNILQSVSVEHFRLLNFENNQQAKALLKTRK